jgi:hypothetical protein
MVDSVVIFWLEDRFLGNGGAAAAKRRDNFFGMIQNRKKGKGKKKEGEDGNWELGELGK